MRSTRMLVVLVYGMRNAFTASQAAPDEAVVCAETWVVCRDDHFLIEGCCITLRLGVAEVLNAVQVENGNAKVSHGSGVIISLRAA